ncbi:MAG: phasin family protein [Acidobacteria bacterium]|nr:phasin family protein [Acidobacteriota bacterium]
MTNIQSGVRAMGSEVLGVGRNIWLAGLGVVAVVGEETKEKFGSLVKKGQAYSDTQADRVKSVKSWVGDMEKRAASTGDKVEGIIQKRVESGLHMMGIPTRDEIKLLIDRVERLSEQVAELNKQ